MLPLRRFHYHFNNIIKILIVSDFVVWSASGMVSIVFPVFIIDNIENGSLEVAGFASMIYLVVSAITTIPMGMVMDKLKGYVDEVKFLFWGTLFRGACIFLYAYTSQIWQLFALQFVLGISRAAMYPSWRLLFSKFADKKKAGMEWSTYDAITTMGMGVTAYLGSFIAEEMSFKILFQISGIATMLGSFLIIFLRMYIKDKKR